MNTKTDKIINKITEVPSCFVYDTMTGNCLYKEPKPILNEKCRTCKFDINVGKYER